MDHADGILEPIKSRNLCDNRTPTVDPELIADLLNILLIQFLILLRERVDAWIKEILWNRQLAGKRRRRKNRRVVLFDEWPQKGPHLRIGIRQVNMTTPNPLRCVFLARGNESSGLRIMDHNKILFEGHPLPVLLV